jgi:lysophospholipase L1-like esterase
MSQADTEIAPMKKPLLAAFCLCAAASWCAAEEKKDEPKKPSGPERFESSILAFEKKDKESPPPADPVLMVGSSSFAMWRSAPDDLKPFPVINRGFGGSTLKDVLHYFDRVVVPYKPRLILLYEGDNDMAGHKDPEKLLADVKTFVERVKKELPRTPVLILSIKPSTSRAALWPKVQEANRLVADYAKTQKGVETVDVGTALLGDDGKPKDELFLKDKLHMNKDGYKLWIEILKPRIEKLLAAK